MRSTSKNGTSSPGTTVEQDRPDLAALEAGLDALKPCPTRRPPIGEIMLRTAVPPLIAVVLGLALWELAYHVQVVPHYRLPSPLDVWRSVRRMWLQGTLLGYVWTSVSRCGLGFAAAVMLGTPLGLLVGLVRPLRSAVGPILSGLQSIPTVAWVPASIIWFGLNNSTLYAVVLLGAVPSIANGLVSGIGQVSPPYLGAGRVIGANGAREIRHILLPAALPGYLAGLKQGWAFSWRSLLAAEIIATSPKLDSGLSRLLQHAGSTADMPSVLTAILLILIVGIGVELAFFRPLERRTLRNRGLLAGLH